MTPELILVGTAALCIFVSVLNLIRFYKNDNFWKARYWSLFDSIERRDWGEEFLKEEGLLKVVHKKVGEDVTKEDKLSLDPGCTARVFWSKDGKRN